MLAGSSWLLLYSGLMSFSRSSCRLELARLAEFRADRPTFFLAAVLLSLELPVVRGDWEPVLLAGVQLPPALSLVLATLPAVCRARAGECRDSPDS